MAKANIKSVVVVPEVRENTVTLTLSEYEAQVLLAVCGRVGGVSKQRDANDSIYVELKNALPDFGFIWEADHEMFTSGGPIKFENGIL